MSKTANPDIDTSNSEDSIDEEGDISLNDIAESEDQVVKENSDETESSNS